MARPLQLPGAVAFAGALLLAVVASCASSEPGSALHSSAVGPTTKPPGAAAQVAPPLPTERLLASAASAPAAASMAAAPRSPRRYVLAAMGDSLTDPRSHGGKYLDVLRERCPKSSFTSFGKGGNMVNMMRKRFLRDVYGEDPARPAAAAVATPRFSHVLILGGLGDIGSNETAGRTAEKIQKDILEMVELSRQRRAQTIVLTIPPFKGHDWYSPVRAQMARDVNDWIVSAARARQIDAFFDTRPSLSCGDPEQLCEGLGSKDNIHWAQKGHRAMGEALHAALFSDCE